MTDEPIRVNSQSWTGDLAVLPSSYRALEPAGIVQRIRERPGILMLLVALGGGIAWELIDVLVWSLIGEPPYLSWSADRSAFYLAIAFGAALAAGLLLTGRHRLIPFLPPAMIGVGGAISWLHFIEAYMAPSRLKPSSFFVQSLQLQNTGRMRNWRKLRATAKLIDRDGRVWELNGRYGYMAQLANKRCVTVNVRQANRYRFPTGPLSFTEMSYLDQIGRPQHPAQCFVDKLRAVNG